MAENGTIIAAKESAGMEERDADCVITFKMGNTMLVMKGYFNRGTKDTAADKMAKALKAEWESMKP